MRRPLLMVCLCLAALRALLYFGADPPLYEFPDREAVSATGHICQKDDDSFYLKIQTIAVDSRQEIPNTSPIELLVHQKVICEYGNAEEMRLGAVVALKGNFDAFSSAANPGEFDYARYYHSLGIAGRIKDVEIVERGERYSHVLELLYRLKGNWRARLYYIFPEKEASVMTAILLGDKSGLDSRVRELYRENGVIHILSISGLHITVIGLGLYRLLRWLGLPAAAAAAAGGTVLVLYGIMTGLSVSACRAVGMYLLRMLAQLCGRTYDMLTALGVMAVIAVWSNAGYLEYMGFWLSFASILGVGVLYPALMPAETERKRGKERYTEGRFRRWCAASGKRLLDAAGQGLAAGASITLTTLPLQLWFSYEVPVYSVLLNVLVLPLMGALMAFGLAAVLVPGLGILGTADVLILSFYERLCSLFEKLPFHTWNPGRPGPAQIVLYYVLWLAVVLGTDRSRQRRKRGGIRQRGTNGGIRGRLAGVIERPGMAVIGKAAVLAAAVAVLGFPFVRADRVTFLDVGQGDCICVQLSGGGVYLFDCGSSSRSGIGERVLIPFLKYYGIRHVDGVFLSHPDADHANGLLELFALAGKEQITIGQVVLPGIDEAAREAEFREVLAAAEAVWQKVPAAAGYVQAGDCLWGREGRFLCLHPASGFPAGNANAYSACFYMELGDGFSVLLTGDVEGAGETALLNELRRQGIENVTVLKTAHHGSRNSTSEAFLEQASPQMAVISCGRKNRYGHPHEELLERLRQQGCAIWRTDESGAVTVVFRGKRAEAEAFRGRESVRLERPVR